MAGNQLGKTFAGGAEAAFHATGRYPDWWIGHRIDRANVGWASGITGESTRDTVQRILLGRPGNFGSGAIPKDALLGTTSARGVADLIDSITVKHVSGATSIIMLKSYEKGREKWQGDTIDWLWMDEEPPPEIYTEGLTRTNAVLGPCWITFTPLLGMSEVVSKFLMEESPDRHVTSMTIDDVDHYTEEQKAKIIASYPAHEREARARGIPTMGSGRIFPVPEESIVCEPLPIPRHWPRINGMDFGWDHPFAAVSLAWDRDADVMYVTATYRAKEQTPVLHAASMKPWGAWVPCAWPHDGYQHDKGSGLGLAEQYRAQGLAMLHEHATHETGGNGVEAGLMEMLDRMQTGRLKVFRHLEEWLSEFRMYHRKDGKVVKERDDLMSATRYAIMMKRYAEIEPLMEDFLPSAMAGGWMGN